MDALRARWRDAGRFSRRLWTEYAFAWDVLLAGAVAIVGLIDSAASGQSGSAISASEAGAVVLGVSLVFRRRLPTAVFLVVLVTSALSANADSLGTFFALLIAAYSMIALGRSRIAGFVILLGAATYIDLYVGSNLRFLPDGTAPYLIFATIWLGGSAIRSRQRRAEVSEDRAARLEREQAHEREMALAGERARIARELHDVVSHNVSVMLVQTGAARRKLRRDPDAATQALLAVESTGREALQELRGFLGVLSENADGSASLTPQPGTGDVEALLQRVSGAGLPVELEVRGERRPLPAGLDLAAYRVVQEGLTNALKYAAHARTEVVLDYRPDGIEVQVVDSGPGRALDVSNGARAAESRGRGLTGLRERVLLYGGSFEAGRRPSGGFALRAWLPLTIPPP